ncbi:hypothetical protein SDC9_52320 [bioreactor metagenome]|uniref:Uncharacterized protein n=1 Tax=bioreactor metagenome TaxID=1076179 RepID=A0A644WQ67_9ZZZZ
MSAPVLRSLVCDHSRIGFTGQYLVSQALIFEAHHIGNGLQRVSRNVKLIYFTHSFRILVRDQDAFPWRIVISEGDAPAAGPVSRFHTLGHAAPRALVNIFPFQLGKDGQDTHHGPAEGSIGGEALLHGDEGGVVGQKHILNEIEGVLLGAAEPVQLHHDHMCNVFFLYIIDQSRNFRPFQIPAAETVVHVIS